MEKTPASRLIGAALLIPALLLWLLALVLPTVRLVLMSFQKIQLLRKADPEFIGTDNYKTIFEHGLTGSILSGVTLALVPLLLFFLVGPLLGWAASHADGKARRIIMAVLMLPLAAFVPTATAFAWEMRDFPEGSFDLDTAGLQLRITLAIAVFGLVSALAITVYAAVFRVEGRPRLAAALTVSGLAVLTAIAIGIQQFGLVQMAPLGRAVTPTVEQLTFSEGFRVARLGSGAAAASIEFAVLAVLGLLAAALIIFTRLRIGMQPRGEATRRANGGATAGLIVAVLVIVGLTVVFSLPWLGGLFNSTGKAPKADFAASWLLPLVATVFAVALAAVGGFGIGALRPLGRFSELLLLPFAPWLFTGTGPTVIPSIYTAAKNGSLGTLWSLVPPLWMFVPALFLVTLLFRGLADRETPLKFLPALPAFVITVAVFTLVQAQDLLWSLVMSGRDKTTAPAAFANSVLSAGYRSTMDDIAYSTVTPLWLIPLVVVGAVLAQWFFADRVVITTGVNDSPE